MTVVPAYPSARIDRDRFVLERRAPRPLHDPWRHQGVLVEDERAADGTIVRVATVFLTGRECPWRCVMCDLWQHTITDDTPPGALVRQLDDALEVLRGQGKLPEHVKLYNAGNFFDPRAVPESDYDAMAERLAPFRRVIVESHPALVGGRLPRFTSALARAARGTDRPDLEVAMGLETAHPGALARLNKGFTRTEFARAADRLRCDEVGLRVFLLVGVPFIAASEQQDWIARSVSFAFACGATVVSLIPTRSGNGALEALGVAPPSLADVEAALAIALRAAPGRVFADLWDLQRFADCRSCLDARRNRLRLMNLEQRVHPAVTCADCGTTAGQPA
jgi:radical SAM enzyme (TIGR01210 family)